MGQITLQGKFCPGKARWQSRKAGGSLAGRRELVVVTTKERTQEEAEPNKVEGCSINVRDGHT